MSDPISWLVLEPGHRVVGSGGEEIGRVDAVVGDEAEDIFNGLMVGSSLFGSARYVPAERVASLDTDAVRLDLTADEFAELDEHGPQNL
jgi:hypothetical protein